MNHQRPVKMITAAGNTSFANVPKTVEIVNTKMATIPDCLFYQYTHQPTREALVFIDTDGSRTAITYGELYEKAKTFAKSYVSLGIKKGEIIAVCLRNCPEWLYVTFGAMMAGAIPIGLTFTYADGSDVVSMMKKLQTCSAIVLDPAIDKGNWNVFTSLISNVDDDGHVTSNSMPYLRYLICRSAPEESHKALTVADMMGWKHPDISLPHLVPEDIACLFQTSGSTGSPKAVAHTHKSTVSSVLGFLDNKPDFRVIMYSDQPFRSMAGFPWNVIAGETRVTRFGLSLPPKDMVPFLFDVAKREQCTLVGATPPLFSKLLDRWEEAGDGWPVPVMGTSGQPISKKFANCIGKLSHMFLCSYGSTEMLFCSSLAFNDPDQFQDHCIGYPKRNVEMKIVNETGGVAPANTRGEIYVRSPWLFKGYYNDTEKTRACLTEDGWYKTDDIGYVTEDGLFFCIGRKSEMIISGARNVNPAVLESLLSKFPGVARVVCVPVPDKHMYQVICACIVVNEGSAVTEQMLRDYCEQIHIDKSGESAVFPTYYLFMDDTAIPETHTGKVDRKQLIRLCSAKTASNNQSTASNTKSNL